MPTLELPDDVHLSILEHARERVPEEVVGVLSGSRRDDISRVRSVHRAENAADAPRSRYEIEPAAELAMLERIDRDGEDVVGFYHSHPRGPLEPSDIDVERAAWPGHSYVIVVPPDDLASWRWTGERFCRERLRTIESP
ncbi:MAG: desampylase [Natronomonas sp.]